jgi:serine/threonine-protein kinase
MVALDWLAGGVGGRAEALMDKTRLDPRRPAPAPGPSHSLRSLGEFRLLRQLGEGGMGEVYLGYQEGKDQHVAIKALNEALAANQDYIDRFYREARSGKALNHPNIVRTFDAAKDPASGRHYLVMEYVEGTNALALLHQQGKLPVADAVYIALDIARALEHAHSRNVIHRDLKPDNILLTRSGLAKLLDFGLAKRTDEVSNLTSTRQGFGTSYYMPYEQAIDAKKADHRSDLYALGATLYHLVTGSVPFSGDNHLEVVEKKLLGDYPPASSLNAEVPRVLDHILGRLLARLPEHRYQTASEAIVDLDRSRLKAAVPSFADPEQARKDPWVQAQLTADAQPTRPDLRVTPSGARAAANDLWLLRYVSADGRPGRGRSTTQQILQRLREGRVPRSAEVCRAADEGFLPISFFAEFQEAFGGAVPMPAAPSQPTSVPSETLAPSPAHVLGASRGWWLLVVAGVCLAAGLVVRACLALIS